MYVVYIRDEIIKALEKEITGTVTGQINNGTGQTNIAL